MLVAWLAACLSLVAVAILPAASANAAGIVPPNNPASNITPAIPMSCNDAINDIDRGLHQLGAL